MKKIITLALAVMVACSAASAQLCSTKEGQKFTYRQTETKAKKELVSTSTVVKVETAADGVVSVRMEDKTTDPSDPMHDQTMFSGYRFNPADTTTTNIIMGADDFKEFIIGMIKQGAEAAGQFVSDAQMAEVEKMVKVSGEMALPLNPNAVAGQTFSNSTLRCTMGPQSMKLLLCKGKYQGREEIEVPAGKFNCVKVEYQVRSTGMGPDTPDQYVTAWYADGIGMVKQIDADKKGNVRSEQVLTAISE